MNEMQVPPGQTPNAAPDDQSTIIPNLLLDDLLDQITSSDCTCTPFIGAGASRAVLGSGREIAKKWAGTHGYPFPDSEDDLSQVAQYLAVTVNPMAPKRLLAREFASKGHPDFTNKDEIEKGGEPHLFLAELPFPVYITTNYDDFMFRALESVGKHPVREYCRWNSDLRKTPSVFDESSAFVPTVEAPVVFHIHGQMEDERSLVLTEDDYLNFIAEIASRPALIPPRIMESIRGTTLLFVGYRLRDWNIKLIMRGLVELNRPTGAPRHIAIQTEPRDIPVEKRDQALKYLEKYFDDDEIEMYWSTVEDFSRQLRARWKTLKNGS